DHGFMVHGTLGCNSEWSYMVAVTNGDGGDSIRNVWDVRTDDNLAYSARLNWAFMKPTFYEEGALRQSTCEWYGEAGAWAHAYDARTDGAHSTVYDGLVWGLDLALGYGGFSMTAAYTVGAFDDNFGVATADIDTTAMLVQVGYLFPGTAWEIAARYSSAQRDDGASDGTLVEMAAVVNYYLNGHANKLSLDVTALSQEDDGNFEVRDAYTGLRSSGLDNDDLLVRFQWQLAL
ncbi:MAG: porin, partial [Planctomycetia bacterium]